MYGDQFEEFVSGYWDLIQGLKGQLYLRPPSQNPVFLNSYTFSLFFHSLSAQLQLWTPFSRPEGFRVPDLPL